MKLAVAIPEPFMWQNLVHFDVSPLNLVVRGTVVYLAVLLMLRISGKRQIGQMGATEFVSILLISNAVQNAMNGGDNSLSGGLLLAVVLIVLSVSIAYLTYYSRTFTRIFEGTPRLLVHNGKAIPRALQKELLSVPEFHVLLRKQGVHGTKEIKSAVLEADGTLSIIRYSDLPIASTPSSPGTEAPPS
jgi:uncharacterized membrane protein YcaP (DUF421 family)